MKLTYTPSGCMAATLWQSETAGPVATRVAVAGDFLPAGNLLRPPGSSWAEMAHPLAPCFADVATTFANLECPVSVEGLRPRPLNGIGQIVSAPSDALDYLRTIRCGSAGIANNHVYDFGAAGMARTRQALLRRGLPAVGAGRTLADPPDIFVWQGPGSLRVGFWAAAQAARDLAGRASRGVEPASPARAAQALASLRRAGAGFCVALIHAGCLRTSRPSPEDVSLLRALAQSGFDLVAASHSHRVAGAETIRPQDNRRAFCFYGLGSLVSGYISSPLESEGLVAVAGFDAGGRLAGLEVRPVRLPASGFGETPLPEGGREILGRFESLSNEIREGSYERHFYQDVSHGLIRLYTRDMRTAFRQEGVQGIARKAARLRLHHVKRLAHRVFGR